MKASHCKNQFLVSIIAAWMLSSGVQAQIQGLPQLPGPKAVSKTFTLEKPFPCWTSSTSKSSLRGMHQGRLILTFPDMPGASAEFPIDSANLQLTLVLPENFNAISAQAIEGDYRPFYLGMKDRAESLLRFLAFPRHQCNFHNICLRYYEAAIREAPLEQAVEISTSMPWESLSIEFQKLAEALIHRSIRRSTMHIHANCLGNSTQHA